MDQQREPAAVLLVSGDLMAGSWLRQPAAAAKVKVDVAASADAALQFAESTRYALVIVDLSAVGQGIRELVDGLREIDASQRILAYGPHVQDHVLEAAKTAGCDRVLTRGQFHAQVAQIFADATAGY